MAVGRSLNPVFYGNAKVDPVWILPSGSIALLLLTLQLLPPAPMYLLGAPSMAVGTSLAAAAALFMCLLNDCLAARSPLAADCTLSAKFVLICLPLVALVMVHAVVADAFLSVELSRFLESILSLVLLLLAALSTARAMRGCAPATIDAAVRFSFYIMMCLLALKLAGLEPLAGSYIKPVFPFTESSHYALALAPVYIYRCTQARQSCIVYWLLGGFVASLLLQSVSLLAVSLVAAYVTRRALTITLTAPLVFLVGLPIELTYFTSRLDFAGTALNLSNLVYVQGWELLLEALQNTSGWGVGFQQMGLHGTNVPATNLIHALTAGQDLNLEDGSFVLSKLGSEFGVFGLILVFLFAVFAYRCAAKLRTSKATPAVAFARCVVVAYVVDMFVRGTGYFTQSTLLFLVATAICVAEDAA